MHRCNTQDTAQNATIDETFYVTTIEFLFTDFLAPILSPWRPPRSWHGSDGLCGKIRLAAQCDDHRRHGVRCSSVWHEDRCRAGWNGICSSPSAAEFQEMRWMRATLFDSSHAYKPGDVHGVNTGEEEDEEDEDEEVEAEW